MVFYIKFLVLKYRFLAFSQGPGGFRELREAYRKHFHRSWYLSDAVVTSYSQKPSWGVIFFTVYGTFSGCGNYGLENCQNEAAAIPCLSTRCLQVTSKEKPGKTLEDRFGVKIRNKKQLYTVDGKTIPPRRVFGYKSSPWALTGIRIGGNGSYKPPGAP